MLFIFGIPSVVLTLMGALLITYLPQEMLKGILGVFLIIYSIISLWKEDLKVRPSLFNSVIGGGLSGFLAGLIGTGGALRGAFLTAFGLPKEKIYYYRSSNSLSSRLYSNTSLLCRRIFNEPVLLVYPCFT